MRPLGEWRAGGRESEMSRGKRVRMGNKGWAREEEWNNNGKKGVRKRDRESESNQLIFQVRDHRKEKKGRGDDLDCCQRRKRKMEGESKGREEKKRNEGVREKRDRGEGELRWTSSGGWLCNVHNAGVQGEIKDMGCIHNQIWHHSAASDDEQEGGGAKNSLKYKKNRHSLGIELGRKSTFGTGYTLS